MSSDVPCCIRWAPKNRSWSGIWPRKARESAWLRKYLPECVPLPSNPMRSLGVAGFLFPGSRVDVLATYASREVRRSPLPQTILQDVEVLTAGQTTEPDPQGKARNRRRRDASAEPRGFAKADARECARNGAVRAAERCRSEKCRRACHAAGSITCLRAASGAAPGCSQQEDFQAGATPRPPFLCNGSDSRNTAKCPEV